MGFMNTLDKKYQNLLQDILDNGVKKEDRTGTGTTSVFGRQIRHKMNEGFPLLTTKKMAWKTIVTELLWFLRGDTNIKFLLDYDCHIWDGDAYKNYEINFRDEPPYVPSKAIWSQSEFIQQIKTDEKFAQRWGELGPIYGRMWRKFDEDSYGGIDQIQNLIDDLKTNPDSRRLMVTAWHPGYNQHSVLPPCHYGFQVYTRELSIEERWESRLKYYKSNEPIPWDRMSYPSHSYLDKFNLPKRAISLMWNQRSVDTFLGLPFNIASYGLLLEIIATEVNMISDELIGNLGDVHLYSNHIDAAKEQIGRKYTNEERVELLKQSMGEENYNKAVDELMPFGGGMSEYYDSYKIPYSTREPFKLPKLNINTEFWQTEGGECGIGPLKTNLKGFEISDFQIENYQSHSPIKAPLSN
jgi:thymidylate synthase